MKNLNLAQSKTQGTLQSVACAASLNDQLLTEKLLAARWCISMKTLQAQRWKGSELPFLKLGRSVRYRLSDIVEFEASHVIAREDV
jgi:hypothetical protein